MLIGEARRWANQSPFAAEIEGLPLGMIPDTVYSQTCVSLAVGDLLLLYRDGITGSD